MHRAPISRAGRLFASLPLRSTAAAVQPRRVLLLLLLPPLPSWTQTGVADRHADTDACLKLTDEIEESLSIEI